MEKAGFFSKIKERQRRKKEEETVGKKRINDPQVLSLFPLVKKVIDEMDYGGFLEDGCPEDEFDMESKEIAARIIERSARDPEEIREIIADVFSKSFDEENSDTSLFLEQGEKIAKALAEKSRN